MAIAHKCHISPCRTNSNYELRTNTNTNTKTNPNDAEADAAGRCVRACDARKFKLQIGIRSK